MSHTIFDGGIGYEGKVTLTLKNNNRILKSKTYSNKGMAPLFNFLGHCLADAFEDVKKLVPSYIMLLYNTDADDSTDPTLANPTHVVQRTQPKHRVLAPTIINDSSTAEVKVTYSFEVPKAAIGGTGNGDRKFNQVALYGAGITDIKEFSAYHYLKNEHDEFDTIDVKDWSETTVLLIEWELTISNKNIETTKG